MNGGRKEDFENMNHDDIQLIYVTYNAYHNKMVRDLSEMISSMFGGK